MKYKIIKSIDQYNEYCNIHEALMLKEEEALIDEIELLELLIDTFDKSLIHEKVEQLNPVELLRSIMKDAGISQSKLASSIEVSKQLINDILGYRRNFSKDLIIKLSKHFSMSQEAFSRSYPLQAKGENKSKKALQKSDLERIIGIGPKYKKILYQAEIRTFEQLSEAQIPYLQIVFEKEKINKKQIFSSWKKQSKYAAKGDWKKMEEAARMKSTPK